MIDILYVTFRDDLEWFKFSLASVQKSMTGYRKIMAVAPDCDKHLFEHIKGVEWHFIPDWPGQGYHWQQWVKIRAWSWTDAEFVCHIDSDVMVIEPIDLSELFYQGKPIWPWQNYYEVPDAQAAWEEATKAVFFQHKDWVGKEFMRCFPFILHRETYEALEAYIINAHQMSLDAYLQHVCRFSEFNCLGTLAFNRQWDLYEWRDCHDMETIPKSFRKVRQFWSHGNIQDFVPELKKWSGL
jgi:hypothetical protein